ncbi:P-loop containing region of AAA domain-containing protein [Rhodoferax sp. OV413]|uniref:ATP-binding protein n=1 Tax=Rhodoferax sp. OV413 TaxID=1855285 RepID=UPI00088E2529|nr:ATP-binding protein [Rhodoferax sp. OV413]SDO71585.1 P-loop containing region of AAA domain-containing protein [Rhodoferax sp. OV413]
MFHLQSLELVHWDYCQRVSLPLDASIITIAGPNGSGKTTLLDAMRTLLGLKCSSPRDYKTYARHAGANIAWLRAVVDNQAQTRQTSSRPFAKRLLYSDQVTLACRIERNGGDWQRRYMVVEGDASIEQLSATPDKDLGLMGIEAWGRVLSAAGLSPAIAKVLSLEQGQTDRLCEFSPRELLRLVFDVFGDQEVLNHYDTAREHQQQLGREMAQAEHELDHSKAQLAELQSRVSNYQNWQHKVQEQERLATEVVPVLEWHGQRQKLTERSREQRRQRQHHRQALAERARQNAQLLELLEVRSQADAHASQLLQERDAAAVQRDSTRDFERPLEDLFKRETELLALVDKESDAEALTAHLQTLHTQEEGLQARHSATLQKRELAAQALSALEGKNTPPHPEDARRLRQRLQAQKIGHRFLAEVVEVRDEHWRAAIEGVLRPLRWMVLLEKADDVAQADSIASADRYRHYITAPGDNVPQADAASLLAQVRFDAKLPRWLIQQLQNLRCVADPSEGRKTSGSWITPQAYSFDGRGARSVWVEPRDHQFGAAALIARRDAVERDLRKLDAELGPLTQELLALKRQIKDCQKSLEGHSAAEELARRNDEFSAARQALPGAKQARVAAAQHWQTLDKAYGDAKTRHQQTDTQYRQLEQTLRQKNQDADRLVAELLQTRKQQTANIDTSNHRRRQIPEKWRTAEVLQSLVKTYQNDTQARLRLQSVHEELQLDTWEKDATVEERYRRMEVLVREQGYSLGDHQAKNAQAGIAVHNARESYIEVLRSTVRRYRKNIQELGELAGVAVNADLPVLENEDSVLAQAGLKVHFNFDGKGSIGLNDGEASGGQQVIKSLILLVALLKDDETASGGFVFIDEPFAHLDVRNIQLVGHFLRSTQAQYVLTTPITHNLEVFEPAEITLITSKKPKNARWAPPIAVAKRRTPVDKAA